jgi:hypothetical protein
MDGGQVGHELLGQTIGLAPVMEQAAQRGLKSARQRMGECRELVAAVQEARAAAAKARVDCLGTPRPLADHSLGDLEHRRLQSLTLSTAS